VEIPANRRVLLARNQSSDKDLEEGSPDHPGETLDATDANPGDVQGISDVSSDKATNALPVTPGGDARHSPAGAIVPAAFRQKESIAPVAPSPVLPNSVANASVPPPASGTVVLDVEPGGIVVPSFAGKSVRSAIELAEASGLDLEIVGSGLAQEQSPAAGARVTGGTTITVKFGR
jgi:cell division protein FtsI (penicillin-binding protein 3)